MRFYSDMLSTTDLESALVALHLSLDRFLVILVAYTFVVFGGAVLVRGVLDAFVTMTDQRPDTRAGRYIGMLERTLILILTLVLVNALPSVVFVLTAKSLARFRELSEIEFGEYYLVGTLTSTCIALVTGILSRVLLKVV